MKYMRFSICCVGVMCAFSSSLHSSPLDQLAKRYLSRARPISHLYSTAASPPHTMSYTATRTFSATPQQVKHSADLLGKKDVRLKSITSSIIDTNKLVQKVLLCDSTNSLKGHKDLKEALFSLSQDWRWVKENPHLFSSSTESLSAFRYFDSYAESIWKKYVY